MHSITTRDWQHYTQHANALLRATQKVLLLFVADDDPDTGVSWCSGRGG